MCGSVTCHGISVPLVRIVHESRSRNEKKKEKITFRVSDGAVHGFQIEFSGTDYIFNNSDTNQNNIILHGNRKKKRRVLPVLSASPAHDGVSIRRMA